MNQVSDLHAQLAAEQARGAEAVAAVRKEAAERLAEKEEMVGCLSGSSPSLGMGGPSLCVLMLNGVQHINRWRR